MLSEQRDEMAATAFFKQAINNGFPHKVVMDKSGANYAGIENINRLLMLAGLISFIEICQVKYLNNVVSQKTQYNLLFSIKVNNSFYKCIGVGGYND